MKKWLRILMSLTIFASLNVDAMTTTTVIAQSEQEDVNTANSAIKKTLSPLDIMMTNQTIDAAKADYEKLLSYIDGYNNIDEVLTADILANFEPAVPVERYTQADLSTLYPGEELWQYVYTATDQMTTETSEIAISLLFYGNTLVTAMLTTDEVVQDALAAEEVEALINTKSLDELLKGNPTAMLQGAVKYNDSILHQLVVTSDKDQYYLLYQDGALIDQKAVTPPAEQTNLDRLIASMDQLAAKIDVLEQTNNAEQTSSIEQSSAISQTDSVEETSSEN